MCCSKSFWPAVAPDSSNNFWDNPKHFVTVSPLTDEETGRSGDRPWDGAHGPKVINIQGSRPQIEYLDFAYVDYVKNALENKFTLIHTGEVDIGKYKSRILALATAYNVIDRPLHVPSNTTKLKWPVISFREISATDPELQQAQSQADPSGQTVLKDYIYRIIFCDLGDEKTGQRDDFKKAVVDIKKMITVFVGSNSLEEGGMVLLKDEDGDWRTVRTP